jgi:hypothetical protein
LLSILVGHSVASIPKFLWFAGDNKTLLKKDYFEAVKLVEQLEESKEILESYILEYQKIERDIDQFPDIQESFVIMEKEIDPLIEPYLKKSTKKKGDLSFELSYKTMATFYKNFLEALRKTQALEKFVKMFLTSFQSMVVFTRICNIFRRHSTICFSQSTSNQLCHLQGSKSKSIS